MKLDFQRPPPAAKTNDNGIILSSCHIPCPVPSFPSTGWGIFIVPESPLLLVEVTRTDLLAKAIVTRRKHRAISEGRLWHVRSWVKPFTIDLVSVEIHRVHRNSEKQESFGKRYMIVLSI